MEAYRAIPPRVVVRAFVQTRTLRPEDYPEAIRRDYDLDALHRSAVNSRFASGLAEDAEASAVLEDVSDVSDDDEDDNTWLHNRDTVFQPVLQPAPKLGHSSASPLHTLGSSLVHNLFITSCHL